MLILADGNPRLLEFLNDEILGKNDVEAKLTELEQSPELWKEKIIWEELFQLIDLPLQKILSYCLVYEIPVPKEALKAVCDSIPDYQQQLQRGLDLGLIEISAEAQEESRVYRVSRIASHIIPEIRLPEAAKVYSLYQKANEKLYKLWGDKENNSEEKWREIFRILFTNKDNSERFRQGFSQMLAVQYHIVADQCFESELRKVGTDLIEYDDGLYKSLKNNLKQRKWNAADKETALIFYLIMVKENYLDFDELYEKIPFKVLKEINRLWLENSNGKLGISIQMEIYRYLKRESEPGKKVNWDTLEEMLGWKIGEKHLEYNNLWWDENQIKLECNKEDSSIILPFLIYVRYCISVGGWGWLSYENRTSVHAFFRRNVDLF